MPRFGIQYISDLLDKRSFSAAVALQSFIFGWEGVEDHLPDRGLPKPIFAALEVLTWFSQGDRSGAWTYYETTPPERLTAVKAVLNELQAGEIASRYSYGSRNWRSIEAMRELDQWIGENEQPVIAWYFEVLARHRAQLDLINT